MTRSLIWDEPGSVRATDVIATPELDAVPNVTVADSGLVVTMTGPPAGSAGTPDNNPEEQGDK